MMELLAPAGNPEALKAALCAGADAVYLGAPAFGARAGAGFTEDELKAAVRLAHLYKRRVYVTVNTLIKEKELARARETLDALLRLRADAVLVQDLGLLKIMLEEYPALPVHASTQMTITGASGARTLYEMGVSRVVLARECDLDTIKAVAATGIECEVFVHGALCVSVSGQCLMSSRIGGRSGNRGRCAQPCRLPYTWMGETKAWLSTRDLCLRDDLPGLRDAGVSSLKIEGRLKRPEYVYTVARAYRQALDNLYEGRFHPMDARERETLLQAFNRGGFSRGYVFGARDAAIMSINEPANTGLPMGKTGKISQKAGTWLCEFTPERTLHNGDGLRVYGDTVIYSGPDVSPGGRASLRLHKPCNMRTEIRRLDDEALWSSARAKIADGMPPIPVDMLLEAAPGEALRLTVTDGENTAASEGETVQNAQNAPLSYESAARSLGKTGGTPFALRRLDYTPRGGFASASALNELRRRALDELTEIRIAESAPRYTRAPERISYSPLSDQPAGLVAVVRDERLIDSALAAGADECWLAPGDYSNPPPKNARLVLPAREEEGIEAVYRVCMNAGQLRSCDIAGGAIPVFNGEALKMLRARGCVGAVASYELSLDEMNALPRGILPLYVSVYGRVALMRLNHCPARTAKGLSGDRRNCRLCEAGEGCEGRSLRDRMGEECPLLRTRLKDGCLIDLCSPKPLFIKEDLPRDMGWILNFTNETPAQTLEMICYYRALRDGVKPPEISVDGTEGRFRRGVE